MTAPPEHETAAESRVLGYRPAGAHHRLGGRVVAIDGFHFGPDAPDDGAPVEPFKEHYTSEAPAALPFMHIDDVAPVVAAFTRTGFDPVTTTELPGLADRATPQVVPYAVVANRL